MRMLNALLLFFLLFLSARANAQCIDSLAIQYGFYCDPRYEPVCGCNGITYRNDCFARNNGVISWQQGICEMIDFDINPNPVHNNGLVHIDIIVRNPGFVDIDIFDHYGRMFYTNSYQVNDRYGLDLSFGAYPGSVYCVIVRNADGYAWRKVIRPEY